MSINSPSTAEKIPEYIFQKAAQFAQTYHNYEGPLVSFIIEDLVGLSLNKLDLASMTGEYDLSTVKERFYPIWSAQDFEILLDLISDQSPYFSSQVQHYREYIAKNF